jgi:hypothetical protein
MTDGRTTGGTASVAVVMAMLAMLVAGSASAACYQCDGSAACRQECTTATDSASQDAFFDLFCGGCQATGFSDSATCGAGAYNECAVPLEACCLPDAPCLDVTAANCAAANGESAGPGSSCPLVPPPACAQCETLGACPATACVATVDSVVYDFFFDQVCTGSCNAVTSDDEACGVGTFSACPEEQGGCTLMDAEIACLITNQASCTSLGGTYLGDGTDCEAELCPLASPTATATSTATVTATATATATASDTPTPTPVAQGGACIDVGQCAPDLFCRDGVCCESICDQPGQSCDVPGRRGLCVADLPAPAPAATPRALLIGLAALLSIGAIALLRRQRPS